MSWTPPASDGGSPIIAFVVSAYVGYAPVAAVVAAPGKTGRNVPGLAVGVKYRFRVRAFNAVGGGAFSKVTSAVTIVARPGTPTDLALHSKDGPCTTATDLAGTLVTITWNPPTTGGAPTSYSAEYLEYVPALGQDVYVVPYTQLPLEPTSVQICIANGQVHAWRMSASNAEGFGSYTPDISFSVP